MTPNYDKIRVAFATGNPVAARDDLIAAIQEAVEHSHHSGEAVRVIRRYLAAMDDMYLFKSAENQVADLQDENERLRIALDRPGQLDASAAMACSSCAAVLSAWFESCARDTAADPTPALARMRRLRLALDTAIEYGTWPDDAALDDLEVSEDAGC